MAFPSMLASSEERMSRKFNDMCTLPTRTAPVVETIERPIHDWVQDGWLAGFESIAKQGRPIQNAATRDELREAYEPDAGLFVNSFYTTIYQDLRTRKGRRDSKKAKLLARLFSLDTRTVDGDLWADLIEDVEAEIPFRHVEDCDLIQRDMRLMELPEAHRRAVQRFCAAWALQEQGYTLPRTIVQRISRDRQQTGLPLVLRRGR
jgi:hypothetical protein